MERLMKLLENVGRGAGKVVATLYEAGRLAIGQVYNNVLPFMAFVSLLIGIITSSGIGKVLANILTPLAGNIWGLLLMSIILSFPITSPFVAPGAVIAQILATVIGVQIGEGKISPAMAMPAFYAVIAQLGQDFTAVALSLAEAEPETVEIGVPAVLFSRVITGPAAVLVGWLFGLGMKF